MRYEPGVMVTEGPAVIHYHCGRGHEWSSNDNLDAGWLILAGIPNKWCSRCVAEFFGANIGNVIRGVKNDGQPPQAAVAPSKQIDATATDSSGT